MKLRQSSSYTNSSPLTQTVGLVLLDRGFDVQEEVPTDAEELTNDRSEG